MPGPPTTRRVNGDGISLNVAIWKGAGKPVICLHGITANCRSWDTMAASLGFLLPYSRTHELEADRIGLILTARAGYDPREAIPFWQRMAAQGGSRPPEFLSTHPTGANRIRQIRALMPEAMRYYRPR